MPPDALTIAGVDPSGGAGIFADRQALHSLGLEAAGVVTLLTSQDADGVHRLEPVAADLVEDQLDCLDLSDLGAVKTGALATPENVALVRDLAARLDAALVVDPVLVAASGGDLGVEGIEKALVDLLGEATVATPNIPEAKALTGSATDDPAELARAVHDLGVDAALVTGGHADPPTDVLVTDDGTTRFEGPRVEGSAHGTGCVHSSLVAGLLARGATVAEAAELAKIRVTRRIADGSPPPRQGPVVRDDPAMARAVLGAERVLEAATRLPADRFPEVGTNVAVHVDGTTATLRARIRGGRGLAGAGPARDGHVARLLGQARTHDPAVRAAINLAPTPALVDRLADRGLAVVGVDRTREPADGGTMSWVIDRAVELHGTLPDAVHDDGARGKEPMLRLLAEGPEELVDRLEG